MCRCDAALFKVYLDLRVKKSRIKKESTIALYWKRLSQVYAQKSAKWMTESVLFDIRNYGLDTSKKEKSGIFIDDLAIMLNHLWIRDEEIFTHERLRVQLSANLILAGATATRPGALIGQLLYENLEFQVFPPSTSSGQRELRAKRFAFREDDLLLYDPLIPMMALLEWYDLRRGSGKKLNEALTPEERNKIMGHRKGDSSTYLQYYMSNFIDVDCQSICFGTAPQHDLVQLAARLRRHDGAPKN
ncbi:hypothetical protein HRG_001311 [Hirsutella rhossiliensis]|uniref:Uncharacterized protein n=1 Tax=Hirsutella rhossiliensis TaxID=111463 RepID=A0A9P8NAE9_9HYPO|nr:uncharacterized protein HRG_01311 [Hirsutella rhossiliensis]KAH0968669.1 hypothetical protein HRG_01311 [Hirsutella rhossiliensis]